MGATLKPFQITLNDIDFIHQQVTFPRIEVIGYDATGAAIYGLVWTDSAGLTHSDVLGYLGTFDPLQIINPLTDLPLYASARVADGLRDVSGTYNNLTDLGTTYGTFESQFIRITAPDYTHYTNENSSNPALTNPNAPTSDGLTDNSTLYANPASDVVDYTPRMISQTVVSGGVTFLKDGPNLLHDTNGAAVVDSYERDGSGNLVLRDANGAITHDPNLGHPTIVHGGTIQDLGGEQDTGAGTYTDHYVDGNGDAQTIEVQNPILFLRHINTVSGDPAVSGWQVLFGQFFDHGLDFIEKPGDHATITVPLSPNDPLYGSIGPDGQPVYSMTISRAIPISRTGTDPVTNPAEYQNFDSPYIDQNQTYGATTQVTTMLREWVLNPNYDPTYTGPASDTDPTHQYIPGAALFDGHTLSADAAWHIDNNIDAYGNITHDVLTNQTLPTLAELRAELALTHRDDLTWDDINNYRARDSYGKILDIDPNTTGVQSLQTGEAIILDMNPHFDAGHIDPARLMALDGHITSVTFDANNPYGMLIHYDNGPDKSLLNLVNFSDNSIIAVHGTADWVVTNELLLESIGDHYVAGDGRANENFGLTALHHIFHEDHNMQLMNLEADLLKQQTADPAHSFAHQWQVAVAATGPAGPGMTVVDGHYEDANHNYVSADGAISWNNAQLFESTKLIVEMEYQHVAIDQYARLVTPDLPEFVTYDTSLNADITLEYGEAAFRFGHSQLRESIDALEKDLSGSYDLTGAVTHYALASAFLNPAEFADVGPSAIAMGMTRQVANEIDEFVTPALQQGLLGQPLDLATINIARGRDLGLPTLNEARTQLYNAILAERAGDANGTSHSLINLDALKPYQGWADFGAHMIHPDDLVSFIAAYSFDGDKAHAAAVIKADGGDVADLMAIDPSLTTPGDALTYAINFMNGGDDGYNRVDLWLGGLAEAHVYGGMLGPTFNAIFEDQMERLMDGDRFYYLYRLDGALNYTTDLNNSITNEQFKDIIERTTDATSLNGDVMTFADSNIDLGAKNGTPQDHKFGELVDAFAAAHGGYGVYSTVGSSTAANGATVTIGGHQYLLDYRPDSDIINPDGTVSGGYNSHEVITGTNYKDYIMAGNGDDTIYGLGGDDYINGDTGANHIYGGAGNDTLIGNDLDDFMDGGAGDDTLYAGASGGLTDIVMGGDGNDHLYGGAGIDNLFGDNGDDYIDCGSDTDLALGGYGNDVMLGGDGPDQLQGQYGDDILYGGSGPDVLKGEQGDDVIMVGVGGGATNGDGDEALGDVGFDVVSLSDSTIPMDYALDLNQQNLVSAPGSNTHYETFDALLTDIEGLVGTRFNDVAASQQTSGDKGIIGDTNENWLVGGSGNDFLKGYGGNDIIVGDSIRLDILDGHWHKTYDAAGNDVLVQDSTGLLQSAGVGPGFGIHFQDLLTSNPNWVFGSDGGTAGTSDTAVFQGNLTDYTLVALDVNGNVVANPHLNWASVVAIKITDNLATRTLPDGVTLVPGDGTDLVIGVEQFKFADQTINPQVYFDVAPTLDLHQAIGNVTVASDSFSGGGNAYARGSGWASIWSEVNDNGSSNNGQIQVTNNALRLDTGDGAYIERKLDLTGHTSATVSYTVNESEFDNSEAVTVLFAADGVNFVLEDTINGSTNNGGTHQFTIAAPPGGFTSDATLRFVVDNVVAGNQNNNNNPTVDIDNIAISAPGDTDPGNNFSTSYTEQLTAAHIASTPRITDPDDSTIVSVKVVLEDAIAGDTLTVGSLPGGITSAIDTAVAGKITLTLTGTASHAAYDTAVAAISFSSTSDNPTNADRHIDVTVNDGLKDSAVATTTVHVLAVDDPTVPHADNIVTNFGTGVTISVPDWTLLANDTDPDNVPTIGSVNTPNSLGSLNHAGSAVTFQDTSSAGGSFKYHVNGTSSASDPTVTVAQDTSGPLDGTAGDDIVIGNSSSTTINGNGGNDIIVGNGGADTLTGGAGSDTFVYLLIADSGTSSATRDVITDFQSTTDVGIGHDRINLAAIDANTGPGQGGDQAFTLVNHSASASASPNFTGLGQLVYYLDNTGHYLLAGNTANGGGGPGGAEFVIDLGTTNKHLSAADFVL